MAMSWRAAFSSYSESQVALYTRIPTQLIILAARFDKKRLVIKNSYPRVARRASPCVHARMCESAESEMEIEK